MKLFNKYIAVFWFFILEGALSYSQSTMPIYNDYLSDNFYLIHPAMAGISGYGSFRLTARRQWLGIEKAPNFETASAEFRLKGPSGFGVIAYRDANGNQSSTGAKITYAYHLSLLQRKTNVNLISFGLSFSSLIAGLDETGYLGSGGGNTDPIITGTNNSSFYGNADFGIGYHRKSLQILYTAFNILPIKRDLLSTFSTTNIRSHVMGVSYALNRKLLYYEPSIMYFLRESTGGQFIDFNIKIYKYYKNVENKRIWGALSYRRGVGGYQVNTNLASLIIGTNINDFMFSYTLSSPVIGSTSYRGLFHQITLGYTFFKSKTFYECDCPALKQY